MVQGKLAALRKFCERGGRGHGEVIEALQKRLQDSLFPRGCIVRPQHAHVIIILLVRLFLSGVATLRIV